jgi:hypothetical protein
MKRTSLLFSCVLLLVAPVRGQDAAPVVTKPSSLTEFLTAVREAQQVLEPVDDYTYVLLKRERINEELQPISRIAVGIRHEPYSVRARVLAPENQAGREGIFVAGQNDDLMLARMTSGMRPLSLDPYGLLAMADTRYSIAQSGLRSLLKKVLAETDPSFDLALPTVILHENARVDGRPTQCFQLTYDPATAEKSPLAVTRMYFDNATGVPIRYEQYTWPKRRGEGYILNEEFTFYDIRFNRDLTDADFTMETTWPR